jgi:hypothetical protein
VTPRLDRGGTPAPAPRETGPVSRLPQRRRLACVAVLAVLLPATSTPETWQYDYFVVERETRPLVASIGAREVPRAIEASRRSCTSELQTFEHGRRVELETQCRVERAQPRSAGDRQVVLAIYYTCTSLTRLGPVGSTVIVETTLTRRGGAWQEVPGKLHSICLMPLWYPPAPTPTPSPTRTPGPTRTPAPVPTPVPVGKGEPGGWPGSPGDFYLRVWEPGQKPGAVGSVVLSYTAADAHRDLAAGTNIDQACQELALAGVSDSLPVLADFFERNPPSSPVGRLRATYDCSVAVARATTMYGNALSKAELERYRGLLRRWWAAARAPGGPWAP